MNACLRDPGILVIPGRVENANPESTEKSYRDSGSGAFGTFRNDDREAQDVGFN